MIAGIVAGGRPLVSTGATDPYWSSVVSLLHFDGSDGASTTVDETGKAVTVSGASISTARSKFGVSSASFDGSADVVTLPSSADFDFGSGDFTIEFFFYSASLPSPVSGLIVRRTTTAQYAPFNIELTPTGKIIAQLSTTGSSWVSLPAAVATIATGTWNHIALVRDGSTMRRFVNGVADGIVTISGALFTSSHPLCIGAASSSPEYSMNGNIDEVRITKGVARYTANFTVPNEAFPNS